MIYSGGEDKGMRLKDKILEIYFLAFFGSFDRKERFSP